MKIVGVDAFGYAVRYAHGEYVMSGGRAAVTQTGTLVRLRTDEGLAGWGEITPLGATYLPTYSDGIRTALRFLAPHLLGLDPTNISAVTRVMDAVLMGHQYAKSPVDIACWDLRGQAVGLPIAALFGGVLQEDFPVYEAVPLGTPESMASFVERGREAGINRFQLKVGNDPHDDDARTRAVVEKAADDTIVIADSNGGWNLLDARIAMNTMADLPVFIEQPCRTTEDSVLAARGSRLPLILDESIVTLSDVYEARARGRRLVDQHQDQPGGRPHRRRPDARRDAGAQPQGVGRGHVGWRRDHGGGQPSRRQHPPGEPAHGLVHERLDRRAHRRAPALLGRRPGIRPRRARARHRGRCVPARGAAVLGRRVSGS